MSGTVGIYVRVSRKGDREDERFHSPGEQAERAIALAVAKGYTPGPVFEDINVSGATPPADRPALGKLLGRIDSGELAGVAAYALDRLSRDPGHGDALVKRITRAGGVVLTPDIPEAIDSPTGEFTFGMLLQVAKLYRSTAGARFASAKERAIRAGIPVGTAPVGYRQRADRTLELDPATAPAVRELYARRAAGGEAAGFATLARFMAEATGRPWSRSGVARVLRNRLYATGRLEYGDVVSDVAAEPLIDEALWHAAQGAESRRPARGDGARTRFLLTGLVRCASCDRALQPWVGAGRRRRDPRRGHMDWVTVENPQRRYRCRDLNCQAKANVDADRLERWVVLESFRAGDELLSRSTAPDLTALEEALAQAERRLAQALEPEAQDALGDAWASTVKARRRERDAVAHELGDARREAGAPVVDFRLRDVWDSYSPEDRRAALGLYWKVIHVGRPNGTGTPLKLVARGPGREAELELPNDERAP
jgi:site-specific DNA recombinase